MSARLLGASHSRASPAPDGMAVVAGALNGSPHFTEIGIPRQCRVALRAPGPPSGPCCHCGSRTGEDASLFYIWPVGKEPVAKQAYPYFPAKLTGTFTIIRRKMSDAWLKDCHIPQPLRPLLEETFSKADSEPS